MAQSSSTIPVEQQRILIPNKNGENLVGILHETGSKEIVTLSHGFRSSKDHHSMVNLANALANEGISAFRFDFTGNGESEGLFRYGNYWSEVDDLRSVIEHFNGANRVVAAIVGHSKGAGVVLLYASKYHDVNIVVNLSARYYLDRGIELRSGKGCLQTIEEDGYFDVTNNKGEFLYRLTREGLMDRLTTNMHKACLQIDKKCRVLTVHGSEDEAIPVEDAKDFDKILPNHKLHIVEGADHVYSSHQAELIAAVMPFIKENLHAGKDKSN